MLKFIALSGTTGVTENLYIYETENEMIIVDCGVGFPESGMLGVDLVIPDFSYIKKNQAKLKGILITHGHEDHIGALPFLFREGIKAPIYATKLVAGFIEDKFSDYGFGDIRINVINPETDTISVGSFRVHSFRISHSVPDSVGFMIETPEGKVFHVADYKFDWTPVDNRPFDIQKLARLATGPAPLLLVSDCLGSTNQGYTESEREIEERIENIVKDAKGSIIFTTISSNISRMQQAINVAQRFGRKICFVGRSIQRKAEIAEKLDYLQFDHKNVVNLRNRQKMNNKRVIFIVSGSYGQPGSALYRAVTGEHKSIKIEKGDTVIFSADPAPPGTKNNVDFLVDRIIEIGADVHYYDVQEDLHVSGHGSQKDIEMLSSIVKPKYFIPIGGTIRHMRAYSNLMRKFNVENNRIFEPRAGEVIEFKDGGARLGTKISVRDVLVDGLGVGDVGETILRDRQILSQHGVVIVLIEIDKVSKKLISRPEIISRGFVFGGHKKDLFDKASAQLTKKIESKKGVNAHFAKNIAIDFLERLFFEETGRRPMVLPLVIEI